MYVECQMVVKTAFVKNVEIQVEQRNIQGGKSSNEAGSTIE